MHKAIATPLPKSKLYKGTEYARITKAPKGMLERSNYDPIKLRWWAANCDTLADFMAILQDERHKQYVWQDTTADTPCGTAACALGWAAFSHIIPGLQYCYDGTSWGSADYAPTIDGHKTDYPQAGTQFFGADVQRHVFNDASWSREQVVTQLRGWAENYRAQAQYEENK